MIITRLQPEHANRLISLEYACFERTWTFVQINRFLNDVKNYAWGIGDCADTLAGFLLVQGSFKEAEILSCGVLEPFRRQGLAGKLLEFAKQTLPKHDIAELFLEVRASNEPAIALYQKYGFTRTHIRKKYYRFPDEDALLMRCGL